MYTKKVTIAVVAFFTAFMLIQGLQAISSVQASHSDRISRTINLP